MESVRNEIEVLKALKDSVSEIKKEIEISFSKIIILEQALLSVIKQLEDKEENR